MDGKRLKLAIRERRCWVCGGRIITPFATFVAGPMCGVNRTSAEPPCHESCAEWSARACPFLTVPKRLRDERDLPIGAGAAGEMIKRNPGVVMLWTSETYKTWRPDGGGVLFNIGEPIAVRWRAEGRQATHEEVFESLRTGVPILLNMAAEQGPAACYDLGARVEAFGKYLPMRPLEGVTAECPATIPTPQSSITSTETDD